MSNVSLTAWKGRVSNGPNTSTMTRSCKAPFRPHARRSSRFFWFAWISRVLGLAQRTRTREPYMTPHDTCPQRRARLVTSLMRTRGARAACADRFWAGQGRPCSNDAVHGGRARARQRVTCFFIAAHLALAVHVITALLLLLSVSVPHVNALTADMYAALLSNATTVHATGDTPYLILADCFSKGPNLATNVVCTLHYPASFTITNYSAFKGLSSGQGSPLPPENCTDINQTITCTADSLGSGDEVALAVSFTAFVAVTQNATASLVVSSDIPDPASSNNTVSISWLLVASGATTSTSCTHVY